MKIALAAHGRFHAFDLARELARLGEHVRLVTNYPRGYVERWGVPSEAIRSSPLHGAAVRAAARLAPARAAAWSERVLHEWFGRLAARNIRDDSWDAVVCWSGIGEETFTDPKIRGVRVCHRSSAHIQVQDRLLEEESHRAGRPVDRPSLWMIAREQREYQLADLVLVPSTFAARTFVEQGMSPSKICVVPLGVDVAMFRPSAEVAEARRQRILAGNPIRIGYVGALSLQKGLLDLIAIAKAMAGRRFELHCTGAPTSDGLPLLAELRHYAHVHPAVPQRELPATYAQTDLFVFPTLQDGFGMVVSQALAAGLPVLSSENCCGPDILQEGVTGWVVPARRTERYIGWLEWCDENRAEFAAMAGHVYDTFTPRTWAQCAGHLMSSLEPFVTPQTARRIPA